jgi:hypothetical protein
MELGEDSDTEDDDEIAITAEVPVIVPETPSKATLPLLFERLT